MSSNILCHNNAYFSAFEAYFSAEILNVKNSVFIETKREKHYLKVDWKIIKEIMYYLNIECDLLL